MRCLPVDWVPSACGTHREDATRNNTPPNQLLVSNAPGSGEGGFVLFVSALSLAGCSVAGKRVVMYTSRRCCSYVHSTEKQIESLNFCLQILQQSTTERFTTQEHNYKTVSITITSTCEFRSLFTFGSKRPETEALATLLEEPREVNHWMGDQKIRQ